MRDVFDTDAVRRDDSDPFVPGDEGSRGRRTRSAFDWRNVSHALMPTSLRDRAISVSLRTNKRHYELEEPVIFRVTLANRIPFPVSLRTNSPVLWIWTVDGVERATHLTEGSPDEPGLLRFARSERKTFDRRWTQRIQSLEGRWRPVDRGEYELSARINVDDAADRGLADETTITIE